MDMMSKQLNSDSDSDADEETIFEIGILTNIAETCNHLVEDEAYLENVKRLDAITTESVLEYKIPDEFSHLKELDADCSYESDYCTNKEKLIENIPKQLFKSEYEFKDPHIFGNAVKATVGDAQYSRQFDADKRMFFSNERNNFYKNPMASYLNPNVKNTAVPEQEFLMAHTIEAEMPYYQNNNTPNYIQNPIIPQNIINLNFNNRNNQQNHQNYQHNFNPQNYQHIFNPQNYQHNTHNLQNFNYYNDYQNPYNCFNYEQYHYNFYNDQNPSSPYNQHNPNTFNYLSNPNATPYQNYAHNYNPMPVLGFVSQQILNSCHDNVWYEEDLKHKTDNSKCSLGGVITSELLNQTSKLEINALPSTKNTTIKEINVKSINDFDWMFSENYSFDKLYEKKTNSRRLYERNIDKLEPDNTISNSVNIRDESDVIHIIDDVEDDFTIKNERYGKSIMKYMRVNDVESVGFERIFKEISINFIICILVTFLFLIAGVTVICIHVCMT